MDDVCLCARVDVNTDCASRLGVAATHVQNSHLVYVLSFFATSLQNHLKRHTDAYST